MRNFIHMNHKIFFLLVALYMLFQPDMNAQDWANLNRFREDNAHIGMPRTCEDRVVFMGNSITQGWIEKVPEFFANRPYINRGISGQTTPQMLLRFVVQKSFLWT